MVHALVCDDYQSIADLISAVLGGMGMIVTTAGDGKQALDLAHSLKPDVIISDIDMPGLSGVALFKALQLDSTGLSETPFILMSSVDRQWEALEAGCPHFLAKPFSIDDIRHMVCKALSSKEIPPIEHV